MTTLASQTKTAQGHDAEAVRAELVSERFLSRIPRDFARQHLILSQGATDESEHLVVAESTSQAAIFNTGVHLAVEFKTNIADGARIAEAIDAAYGRHRLASDSADHNGVDSPQPDSKCPEGDHVDRLLAEADRDLLSTEGKAPVVQLVDALVFEALARGASDLHIQPLSDRTLVRYRLDGVLQTVRQLSQAIELTQAMISRIKVMGRMDIAERRVPQDGRATVTLGHSTERASGTNDRPGKAVDLRISTLPTSYGERAVIRLLDNRAHLCDFQRLGMPPEVAEPYLERANRSNGMILLTGPTGSGKTTTLYSTLRQISLPDVNIMTIEDPIEYELATVGLAISQAQVNPRKGVTFATGLRHILRQDPDIVMIGEIRDAETARIAVQSSLTGHLVFSTLHTNDAASAATRLVDLGIEPYLVSDSLSAVLAQRLVRTLHESCEGQGCEECFGTGFRGRTGLFELLLINEAIRELILRGSTAAEIRRHARERGMRTLQEDGERLVAARRTTMEEARRVVLGAW